MYDSFKDYVDVETLDGDNQYRAENHGLQVRVHLGGGCGGLCASRKGFRDWEGGGKEEEGGGMQWREGKAGYCLFV